MGNDHVSCLDGGPSESRFCSAFPASSGLRAVILPRRGRSSSFQGVGVPHPFALQLLKHLDMLLRYSANRTKTGQFLEANLQAHQLETGTKYGIFQQVFCNTGILTSDTWVKRVWEELDSLDMHVEFLSPRLELQRDGDQRLMQIFIDALVDQTTLKWLNWCRVYLHAVTLSDIVTADGAQITREAWSGFRDSHRLDRYVWPRTARPASRWWDVWRACLARTVLAPSVHRRLTRPLGEWNAPDLHWRWQYSPETRSLYHLEGSLWVRTTPFPTPSRHRRFRIPLVQSFASNLPQDCVRASVEFHSRPSRESKGWVSVLGVGSHVERQLTNPNSILDVWRQQRASVTPNYGWVPETVTIEGSEQRLLLALRQGKLRAISDGSYKNQLGTACVQIRTLTGSDVMWILCQTPGKPEDQSSTRSELIGLLAALMALGWMAQLLDPPPPEPPPVEVACDGLVALRKSFYRYHLKPSEAQFDLASTIRETIRRLPLSPKSRHVRGHSDRKRPQAMLDWFELRNLEVDSKAQAYRRHLESIGVTSTSNPCFFDEPAALFISNEKVSRVDFSQLLDSVTLPDLKEHWATRFRLSPAQWEEVDWTSVSRAMHALPAKLQRWTAKHTTGFCGVGKFRVRWKSDTNSSCPRCSDCPIEDHLHVPRCHGVTAVAEWKKTT
mmetsp:Transcript_24041/g.58823  ORF Transcript_24041/g.58823 Transcript_24041/m.58823 type:complete len:668 (+) Transcript_24041:2004-4007(+)